MLIWNRLFLQIFCSPDTSILLQLSNWLISWGTSHICMVLVECRCLESLHSFPNNPTSSSDHVSINLLQWSCQVRWLFTVLGYLTGPCIYLEFESTYAMATRSRFCKWCHQRLTLEASLVAFLRLCDFQILLLLEGLLLFLILWWVWATIVICGAEYFFIRGQRQWLPSNGLRISGFLNSEPYSTGDPACASIAFFRLNWWLYRTMKFFSAASVVISKQNAGFLGQGFCCLMISFMMSNMLCRNVIMSLIARDSKPSCDGGAVVLLVSRGDSKSIWYSGAGLIILTLSQNQMLLVGGAVILLMLRGDSKSIWYSGAGLITLTLLILVVPYATFVGAVLPVPK